MINGPLPKFHGTRDNLASNLDGHRPRPDLIECRPCHFRLERTHWDPPALSAIATALSRSAVMS
jgi:hypothetical protein